MIGTLLERLFVAVGADLTGLTSELDRAGSEVSRATSKISTDFTKLGSKFQSVGRGMATAGAVLTVGITAPFTALVSAAIPAAVESAKAVGQVEAALKSMGAASGKTMADLTGLAAQLQRVSTFDDDEILSKVTANLLTFGNVSGKVFDRASAAIVDISARMGTDLQSATIMVGKALNDPVKGLAALSRVGIQFTAQQKEQITAMAEAGNTAGAQAIMLKELERQFGGSAKAMRDATPGADTTDAWRQFQETIGAIALKFLPPLTNALTGLLNLFNNLSPQMQTVAVVAAGLAAALGPLLAGVGLMVSGIGGLLPLLGGAGLAGAFASIGAVALPAVAVVGALAAAWALFGDKIGPVLSELGGKLSGVLGPETMALIDSLKASLMALWQGPLGNAVRGVIDVLGTLAAGMVSTFGPVLIAQITSFVQIVTAALANVVDVINIVAKILTGDFAGAWELIKGIVTRSIATMLGVIENFAPGAIDAVKRLYEGVKTWIVDRLSAVWETVGKGIEKVKGWFFGLYDAVVGHSYIPDMVDEIGANMARLQSLMVDPAKAATDSTKEAFRTMAADAASLLDRLFPVQAQINSILADLATLEKAKGILDPGAYAEAKAKLQDEIRAKRTELPGGPAANDNPLGLPDFAPVATGMEELGAELAKMPAILSEAGMAAQRFGEDLGDTLMGAINAVLTGKSSLGDALKQGLMNLLSRSITDALKSLETAIFGEGGLGGFLGGIFGGIFKSIQGRAVGGPTIPGRAYTVGNGELFVPGAGRVLSRSDAMAAAGAGGGRPGHISVSVSGARGNQEIMAMVREGVQQGLGQYDSVVGERVDNSFKRRAG